MKTAEEILMENAEYGFHEFTETFTSVHKQHFLRAMKIYANQKLDLAVEELGNHPAYFTEIQGHEHDKQSILNLKDTL